MLASSLTRYVSSVQVAIQVEFTGPSCNSRGKKAEVCHLEVQFSEVYIWQAQTGNSAFLTRWTHHLSLRWCSEGEEQFHSLKTVCHQFLELFLALYIAAVMSVSM